MKLLLVSYYFGIADSTGGARPRAMAKYLPDHGVDVIPLALRPPGIPSPDFPAAVWVPAMSEYSSGRWRYLARRSVQEVVRRSGCYWPILGEWRSKALRFGEEIIQREKPDALLVSYPPVEALEIGLSLSSKFGLPLVADFRDGLLFEPVEAARLRYSAVRRHYAEIERATCRAASLIVTVSPPISDYFESEYSRCRVLTIPNGYDPEVFPVAGEGARLVLGADAWNIVHTGRFSGSRAGTHLQPLLEGFLRYQRKSNAQKKLRLHLVGELTSSELDACALLRQSGALICHGQCSRADAIAYQRTADALLLVVAPGQKSIATGKLFEYLLADAPILALAEGSEAGRIVQETQRGEIVPPDEPERIADALLSLEVQLAGGLVRAPNEIAISRYARPRQMAALADALHDLCR